MISMRWCGTCARSAAPGFAVPMSMPRYTSAESMDTISIGCLSAALMASADLPLAVGPRSAKTVRFKLPPAGDVEQGAADVGGFVRGEPQDGTRDLLRFAGALERRGGSDAIHARRVAAREMDCGPDHAGPYAVYPDAFGSDLLGETDGKSIDRPLGGGVIDIFARRAELRRDRRHVDDGATRAAVALRHALHRLARAQEAAEHVDREHALDALGRHRLAARAAVHDPGVIHEHIHAAELLVDGFEQAHDVGFGGHVRLHRQAADLARELFGRVLFLAVIDADAIPAPGGEPRGGGADAASAARHDEHLHLPRMKRRSRSAMVSWYQVGLPWLQLPERSVSSISRSKAFISAMLSARFARTAAWQAIVARSSFWREDRTWLAPNSRISASRPRASPTISPPASATGAARTAISFGPDTVSSRPRRSSASRFSSAVATSSASP